MKKTYATKKAGSRKAAGAALVLALAALVLILGITLAFFSRATLQRQISSSSASNAVVALLGQTALEVLQGDILHEIEAGSMPDSLTNAKVNIRQPILLAASTFAAPAAASMSLQRVGDEGILNILKVSRASRPFFSSTDGYLTPAGKPKDGQTRASMISTGTLSANGRRVSPARWNRPQLMTGTEQTNKFKVPDWIYLDREGKNPTSFTSAELKTFADSTAGNNDCVLGRFAYVIYDEGGLLDINVLGNALAPTQNERKGRLHQVSLSGGIGGVSVPQLSSLVSWRSPLTSTKGGTGSGELFDPAKDFIAVPTGEQIFINRQDLIKYTSQTNSPLPAAALPYLTTYSRDVNAPSYGSPVSLALPNPPPATEMNPTLLAVRFPAKTTLARPEGSVTVEAGTPVMPRRFPLGKLSLLAEAAPDAAKMLYYFGLQKNSDGNWDYVAHKGGRIARLSEVITDGREPNFFEVLQAVIVNGSLGRSGGDSYTFDNARDSLQNLQVMQIGANIIDQWDTNDLPTTLRYPSGNAGQWLNVYGVENLPYFSNFHLVGYRPSYDRDRFQIWGVFDVWNPHQNALTPPQGITSFRIRPRSGRCSLGLGYLLAIGVGLVPPGPNGGFSGPRQSIVDLNADVNGGNGLTFDPNVSYAQPVIIGGGNEPTSTSSYPGILFCDYPNIGPAVPAKADRTQAMQIWINSIVDMISPVAASTGFTTNILGERVYAKDPITFASPITSISSTYWTQIDGPTTVTVYGNYGVKAQSWYRIYPEVGNEITLELQAQVNGTWRTYQEIDGFLPKNRLIASEAMNQPWAASVTSAILTDTHYSRPPVDLTKSWYGWRQPSAGSHIYKIDPRTIRFGHSTDGTPTLGTTIRMSTLPYTGTTAASQYTGKWRVSFTTFTPGRPYPFPPITDWGFEFPSPFFTYPFGYIANSPDGAVNITTNPGRYKDRDNVIRPADGYLGAVPTATARYSDRPLILNRPFRSVGEMGYVFRDLPWKTLDMFTRQSGDLGLLDAFSLEETNAPDALVAGKVNLNTRQADVLASLLLGSANGLSDLSGISPPGTLSSADAQSIAAAIVAESTRAPFLYPGDVVSRVLAPQTMTDPTGTGTGTAWKPILKTTREAAIRTLSSLTTTRTWNLMVDLVVQSGKFSPNAKTGADFVVRAERRYWIHLTVDRMTGRILDRKLEVVDES